MHRALRVCITGLLKKSNLCAAFYVHGKDVRRTQDAPTQCKFGNGTYILKPSNTLLRNHVRPTGSCTNVTVSYPFRTTAFLNHCPHKSMLLELLNVES
jgi:hypothetical protein